MKKRGKKLKKSAKKHSKKLPIKDFFFILLRYLLLLVGVFSLPLIYKILTPLTIYPVRGILDLVFKEVMVYGDFLIINMRYAIELVPSCIAGSAFLLLLILNLAVQMPIRKRLTSLILSFLILYIVNLLRISFFSILSVYKNPFFNFAHSLFWYGLSLVLVVVIWFLIVKLFSIKAIPFYTDLKILLKNSKI
jgi:exosortase/archaeosortase family protein